MVSTSSIYQSATLHNDNNKRFSYIFDCLERAHIKQQTLTREETVIQLICNGFFPGISIRISKLKTFLGCRGVVQGAERLFDGGFAMRR